MTTFVDFGLKPQLLKSIEKLGYTEPTQIQADVWNAAKDWANIVGQSQTGTGKTTAFLLPLLQQIDSNNRYPQVLIVAPTRELVQQIRDDIMKLTEFLPIRSMTLMGGKSMRFQKEDLRYGPQFIVATPGRLIEFMQERFLDVSRISHFVLDEVDRMLDMGFIEDVDRIWGQLPNIKQTMTFSATINNEVKDVITRHCPEYVHIRMGGSITIDKIDHTYIDMTHEQKFPTLMHLIETHNDQKTIIFAQTKRNTEVLARALFAAKKKVLFLNGDLDMRQRTRALRSFKEGSCKILVTTDVAARWLNMDAVELVVNFDVPREPESYIHRIGRTGRAGADGKAVMFVDSDERHLVMDIEKTQKIKLKKHDSIKAVNDEKDEYFDINLDRPLPPSDKKRRMLARSLSGGWYWGRWGDRGWFGWRSSWGRSGYAGRTGGWDRGWYSSWRSSWWFGWDRGGRSEDRGGYGRDTVKTQIGESARPTRSYNDAPRQFNDAPAPTNSEWKVMRPGIDRRPSKSSTGDRTSRDSAGSGRLTAGGFSDRPARSFDRPMNSAPRREYSGAPRSSGQFDAKPESRRDRNTTYGERAFGERKPVSRHVSTQWKSIGGYDVDFVTEQRTMDRDRFAPRTPRPTGDGARSTGWARSFGSDRPRSSAPRWDRPTGDRPARPRLSSKPAA